MSAQQMLEEFSPCEPVLAELREASRRPRCRFNGIYEQDNSETLLPTLGVIKKLTYLFSLRGIRAPCGRPEQQRC